MTRRLYYLIGQGFVVFFVVLTMVMSLPHNPLSSYSVSWINAFHSTVPEGWAFFTRDPREDEVLIFYKRQGQWQHNPLTPLSKASNWFGFDRQVRAQSVEMAMLITQPEQGSWKSCDASFPQCLAQDTAQKIVQVYNNAPVPVLKDTIAIVTHQPVPWAWAELKNAETMPAKYVIMNVVCGKQ